MYKMEEGVGSTEMRLEIKCVCGHAAFVLVGHALLKTTTANGQIDSFLVSMLILKHKHDVQ